MKNFFFLMLVGLLVFSSSCKKYELEKVETNDLQNVNVPDNFDWKTYQTIDITMTGYANALVQVASPAGTVYGQAALVKNQALVMSITVPTYETHVNLLYLGHELNIEAKNQTVNFN